MSAPADAAAVGAALVRALGGGSGALPDADAPDRDSLIEAATLHGVGPLLARAGATRRDEAEGIAVEMLRAGEVARVLAGLAGAGVRALVMKGTPLAYTHYPAPHLRPRADTDVLVAPDDAHRAWDALEVLGYRGDVAVSGRLLTYQRTARRRDAHGIDHAIDLHWRVSNLQGFARALAFEALDAAAIEIPALGAHARALAPVDALVLACLHRIAHRHAPYRAGDVSICGPDRLIWLLDIHLLACGLASNEWDRLVALARSKGLRRICLDGLARARSAFDTAIPAAVEAALAGAGAPEPAAAYLRGGALRLLLTDLALLPGWRERATLVAEHLLPPKAYMHARYGTASDALLPALYVHRAVGGAWRRLRGIQTRR